MVHICTFLICLSESKRKLIVMSQEKLVLYFMPCQFNMSRGGAAKFGLISITYHKYIMGVYKYILRLEISIFDRKNAKNRPKFRMIVCFWDIQSGEGISTNVGYREIFSFSNILISPIDILIVSYDVNTC